MKINIEQNPDVLIVLMKKKHLVYNLYDLQNLKVYKLPFYDYSLFRLFCIEKYVLSILREYLPEKEFKIYKKYFYFEKKQLKINKRFWGKFFYDIINKNYYYDEKKGDIYILTDVLKFIRKSNRIGILFLYIKLLKEKQIILDKVRIFDYASNLGFWKRFKIRFWEILSIIVP